MVVKKINKNVSFYLRMYIFCPIERIAGIDAVYTVSTRRMTDSTEVVYMVVQKGNNVTEVSASQIPTNTLITVTALYIYMYMTL